MNILHLSDIHFGRNYARYTLNVYTHSTSRIQQEAARIIGNVMPKMQERWRTKERYPAAKKSGRESKSFVNIDGPDFTGEIRKTQRFFDTNSPHCNR